MDSQTPKKRSNVNLVIIIISVIIIAGLTAALVYLFNETKILVVNWPKWHDKLQHLFCGAIYNQWKIKNKHAVPQRLIKARFDYYCALTSKSVRGLVDELRKVPKNK